jgi:prevent-host-death family protein
MEQDIRPVTWVKNCTREMLEQVNETRRPIIVTQDGKPRAVIQDPKSYESTTESLAMMKLLAMREREAEEGKLIPQDEVFAQVRQHIRKMRRRKTA